MTVIRCGDSPVPPVLAELPRVQCAQRPTREDMNTICEAMPESNRLVVCGDDSGLAAVLTRFMRAEALTVEFAYVTDSSSPATRNYGLPTGSAAARLALRGTAHEVPLVRDDTATALVGRAVVTGPGEDGSPLVGETYADDQRVFLGSVPGLEVRPTLDMPGVRASDMRRHGLLRRTSWFSARAVQLGTEDGIVTKDGVRGRRPVKRTSFYRHIDPFWLVTEE